MRATLFSTTTIGILIIFLGHQIDAHSSFRGLNNNNTTTTIDTHHRQLQCSAQSACTNGACCSQWGFCGFSDSHCGANCISGCPSGVTPPPSPPPPTPLPVTPPPTPQPVVIGDNKIINGNFESTSISPWYANSNVGTINIDTSTYHTGYQSIFASNRSTGTWNGVEQNILSTNNGATGVVPNERYVISSYVKLKDTTTTLPQTIRITIRLKDTNNNEGWIGISQLVPTTEWTLIQGELTINTNNVNVNELQGVYLYINGPDINVEYWVDNVSVVLANGNGSSDNPTLQPSKSPIQPTNVPSSSPITNSPTLPPSNNPISSPLSGSCPHSIFNKDICCNEACGTCGGSGCGSRPGGGSNCCSGTIRDSGVMCIDSDPPCIISEEDPTLLPTNRPVTSAPVTDSPTVGPSWSPSTVSPTSSPSLKPSVSLLCVVVHMIWFLS